MESINPWAAFAVIAAFVCIRAFVRGWRRVR